MNWIGIILTNVELNWIEIILTNAELNWIELNEFFELDQNYFEQEKVGWNQIKMTKQFRIDLESN